MAISGLSLAGSSQALTDTAEASRVMQILMRKYLEQTSLPRPEEISIFHVTPTAISLLDDSKGFGQTDVVSDPGD